MANPHTHGNHGFPFYNNGVYSGALTESQQQQSHQQQPQYQHHQQQLGQAYVVLNPNPHCKHMLFSTTGAMLSYFLRMITDKLLLSLL
ncbi:hypothetical protein P8452_36323 [Trifolium repens]|jgi:hypothetical protein|nr:hypothetical protein QL285_067722 [Trifolium repens]WJX49948.1 hypothetical protein P8452_36323 [Trifolium repens]